MNKMIFHNSFSVLLTMYKYIGQGAAAILLLSFPFAINAQQDATPLLNKLISKYKGIETTKSHVRLILEFPEQDAVEQKMTVIQDGSKFRVESDDQLIISNGKTIWTYTPSENRVVLTHADDGSSSESMNFNTPHSMLSQLLEQSAMQQISGYKNTNGSKLAVVEMKPKDADSEFFKVKLHIDPDKLLLKQVKSFSKDGSRYTLIIDRVVTNPPLPKGIFVFDKSKYPGVEVEDIRA